MSWQMLRGIPNRRSQRAFFVFLLTVDLMVAVAGLYSLHDAPALRVDQPLPFPITCHQISRIDHLHLRPSLFLKLPEFFSPGEETVWWQGQRDLYELLRKKGRVEVELQGRDGSIDTVGATIVRLPLLDITSRVSLVYLVVFIYLIGAFSVFRTHRTTAGVVLAFFLLFASLYLLSSIPVMGRSLTLHPLCFRLFIYLIYISAGGLITLVHFAFVFPRKKEILQRYPWLPWVFYGYFLLTTSLYLSGVIAFGATCPFLFIWTLIMIGAFLHSLLTEKDAFFRRQITLSLLAPPLVGSVFLFFYIFPGILGRESVGPTQLALFSLILPLALPSAMSNLRLYQERLQLERNSIREKEQLCQVLHDDLGNDLLTVKFLSEVAAHSLKTEPEKASGILQDIRQTVLQNIERLREFLWVVDGAEDSLSDLLSQFKEYAYRVLTPLDIDVVFENRGPSTSLHLGPFLKYSIFSIYKEAMTNIIKHSRARRVEVSLHFNRKGLELRVVDDGVGFDPSGHAKGGYGLRNMKGRARDVGAELHISSAMGKGTELSLLLPKKYLI